MYVFSPSIYGPLKSNLRADDLPGPGLVFRAWVEMNYLHLHRLQLQVLGGDSAHFVCDLIALNGNIFPIDAETEDKCTEPAAASPKTLGH